MHTLGPVDKIDELVRSFQRNTVNHTYALNFILGTLKTRLIRGDSLSSEELLSVLESALRFSKIRN